MDKGDIEMEKEASEICEEMWKSHSEIWSKWAEENDNGHDECEWDEIGDIFTKAIKRKGLNKEQAIKMIEDIKGETRSKIISTEEALKDITPIN